MIPCRYSNYKKTYSAYTESDTSSSIAEEIKGANVFISYSLSNTEISVLPV